MKRINGCYNGNRKKFSPSCLLGFHDWAWTKGTDDEGNTRCAVRCERCNEMRALSEDNADMHDMEEVKKTVGVPTWMPVSMFFSWHFIEFEIDDDGAVKSLDV